uniref:1,4-alpha-glucan branching enzyme n=1 Tax=Tetradesmus obliquus TaxID=3088 RepID=A0A383W668_TETOB|eukprot:jgi/Sobl393_1/15736/SZX73147.1
MTSLFGSHVAAPGLHSNQRSSRPRATRQHASPIPMHSKRLLGSSRPSLSMPNPIQHQQQKQQQQRLQPVAVSYADAPSQAAQAGVTQPAAAAAAVARSPKHNTLQEAVPWRQAGHGLSLFTDGSSCFRVWAPHATSATLQVVPADQFVAAPPPALRSNDEDAAVDATPAEYTTPPDEVQQAGLKEYRLDREGADWGADLPAGVTPQGAAYRLILGSPDGNTLMYRRDPWARSAEAASSWCFVHSPAAYTWQHTEWQPLSFDKHIIYEMHIGSFTPEGTLRAAITKLPHIASLGFTLLELMPCQEHSDPWGYNPRQLLALHRGLGTPEDMAAFVDAAHGLGLGVMMDVVLHHGAPNGNMLWDFDGWEEGHNGGIYHEGAPDCMWGRQWAFWKGEVRAMIAGACEGWLRDYRMDGLRFDSIKDVPMDMVQEITWGLKQRYPGRFLSAEITPEDPRLMAEYGFDAIWVHSGYFDIIQQHRALGRGHHGGGDWAGGWDLPKLREAMGVHYGFERPDQCIKYMTGSHDQVVKAERVLEQRLRVGCSGYCRGMMAAVADVNALRVSHPVMRYGWSNCIHEDRANGIMGYERVAEGEARVIVVVNAARGYWQDGNYGLWVGGGGSFQQIYCSQDVQYGGDPKWVSNDIVAEYDGKIYLNLPPSCTLMLVQQG